MTRTKRSIALTAEERRELTAFTGSGMRSVKLLKRAQIILALDISKGRSPAKEADIALHIGVCRQTIQNSKKDFLAPTNRTPFLQRKKRETPLVPPKVIGEVEARIPTLAYSKPPEGFSTWTLRLLADTCVELSYVDALSPMTTSRLLKKRRLNLA